VFARIPGKTKDQNKAKAARPGCEESGAIIVLDFPLQAPTDNDKLQEQLFIRMAPEYW
jgi:hypothetical protein